MNESGALVVWIDGGWNIICKGNTQFYASVCVITISGTEHQFPQWKVWSLHLFGRRGYLWVDGYNSSNTSIDNCWSKQTQNKQSNIVHLQLQKKLSFAFSFKTS